MKTTTKLLRDVKPGDVMVYGPMDRRAVIVSNRPAARPGYYVTVSGTTGENLGGHGENLVRVLVK